MSDSYDIYNFVDNIVGKKFKDRILSRRENELGLCKLVTRPDSNTPEHPLPEDQMVWICEAHWRNFGGHVNSKNKRVLNPKIGALWGDGIDRNGINAICAALDKAGFSVENVVFGMGGGLLQKINRDTQRFAFKSSAQCRDGVWHDIYKKPRDLSKASKRGKLKLVRDENNDFETVMNLSGDRRHDELVEVFRNGELLVEYNFDEVRKHAHPSV